MPVERHRGPVAVERLGQAIGAEERVDDLRLAEHCPNDRRVVHYGHPDRRRQSAERHLELVHLVERGADDGFRLRLAERRQRSPPEATHESLDAREADVVGQLERVADEHVHAASAKDREPLLGLAGLVIVVPEHTDDRNLHVHQLADDDAHFRRQPAARQIAAEHEHVRVLVRAGEQLAICPGILHTTVEIADRRHAHRRSSRVAAPSVHEPQPPVAVHRLARARRHGRRRPRVTRLGHGTRSPRSTCRPTRHSPRSRARPGARTRQPHTPRVGPGTPTR